MKHEQTTVIPKIQRHERIDVRQNIQTYVIDPTRELAGYGAWVGLGVSCALSGFMLVRYGLDIAGYILALVVAPVAFLYGLVGFTVGHSRLRNFEVDVLVDETEYQEPPAPQEPRIIPGTTPHLQERPSKAVSYLNKSYTFTGRQLISAQSLLSHQKRATRDGIGISGSNWGMVKEIMIGKGFWDNYLDWTEAGIAWLQNP